MKLSDEQRQLAVLFGMSGGCSYPNCGNCLRDHRRCADYRDFEAIRHREMTENERYEEAQERLLEWRDQKLADIDYDYKFGLKADGTLDPFWGITTEEVWNRKNKVLAEYQDMYEKNWKRYQALITLKNG